MAMDDEEILQYCLCKFINRALAAELPEPEEKIISLRTTKLNGLKYVDTWPSDQYMILP